MILTQFEGQKGFNSIFVLNNDIIDLYFTQWIFKLK